MQRHRLRFGKYFALFSLTIVQGLKNYKMLIGLSIFMIACLLIFSHLWQIASARIGGVIYTPDQLLWYIAFNEWVLVSLPGIQNDMEHDLRSGKLAYFLPRPISYLGTKFAEGSGNLFLNLAVLGPVAFTMTWFWTKHLPFSLTEFGIAVILGILAGILGMIFQMLVGLSAFWLDEVGPFHWVWEKLLFVFGGLMLPLTAYPLWLQSIASWSPFAPILGGRSELVIQSNASQIIWVTGSLIVWSLIGIALLRMTFKRGLRILNIQGG